MNKRCLYFLLILVMSLIGCSALADETETANPVLYGEINAPEISDEELEYYMSEEYLKGETENTVVIDENDKFFSQDSQDFLDDVTVRQVKIMCDSQEVVFPDAQPFIDENNRIAVPIRMIANILGYDDIVWNGEEKSVTATQHIDETGEDYVCKFTIGSNIVETKKHRSNLVMDTVPVLKEDRVYLPLRHIANSLGYNVFWDEGNYTATLLKGAIISLDHGVIYYE